MKPEEMMLGDWISFNGEPVKVQQVVSGINEFDYEPIPLTAEILKKNGFERYTNCYTIGSFSLLPNEDETLFYTHIDSKGVAINYVHELQHILRICRIDKEIVL